MFTQSDRREISEIKKSLTALVERYDIHAELVEMNATLKSLLQGDGMTSEEVREATRRLEGIGRQLREASKDPTT